MNFFVAHLFFPSQKLCFIYIRCGMLREIRFARFVIRALPTTAWSRLFDVSFSTRWLFEGPLL